MTSISVARPMQGSLARVTWLPRAASNTKGRSVSQAKPAYTQANGCAAATRSLAAAHG